MKTGREDARRDETQLELKYCERCGGLWLRPAGGRQIYCKGCARQMAELPPASEEPETARMSQGPRWGIDEDEYELYEGDENDLDAAGGVA